MNRLPFAVALPVAALLLVGLAASCGSSGGAGAGSGGGSNGGSGGSAGTSALPACVGACQPSQFCTDAGVCTFTECNSDSDCPSTQHNYTINGSRCVTVCGSIRLCRDACSQDSDCGLDLTQNQLYCSAVADDGTHYCESAKRGAYQACTVGAACGAYTMCAPGFRPAP